MRAHDNQAPRFGCVVVARLDSHLRIGDRILQRLRAAHRRRLGPELDAHAPEHRVERGRVDDPRDALDYGFGEQVFARDAFEGMRRQRRHARSNVSAVSSSATLRFPVK